MPSWFTSDTRNTCTWKRETKQKIENPKFPNQTREGGLGLHWLRERITKWNSEWLNKGLAFKLWYCYKLLCPTILDVLSTTLLRVKLGIAWTCLRYIALCYVFVDVGIVPDWLQSFMIYLSFCLYNVDNDCVIYVSCFLYIYIYLLEDMYRILLSQLFILLLLTILSFDKEPSGSIETS